MSSFELAQVTRTGLRTTSTCGLASQLRPRQPEAPGPKCPTRGDWPNNTSVTELADAAGFLKPYSSEACSPVGRLAAFIQQRIRHVHLLQRPGTLPSRTAKRRHQSQLGVDGLGVA